MYFMANGSVKPAAHKHQHNTTQQPSGCDHTPASCLQLQCLLADPTCYCGAAGCPGCQMCREEFREPNAASSSVLLHAPLATLPQPTCCCPVECPHQDPVHIGQQSSGNARMSSSTTHLLCDGRPSRRNGVRIVSCVGAGNALTRPASRTTLVCCASLINLCRELQRYLRLPEGPFCEEADLQANRQARAASSTAAGV
jgi:hypothetical protein